MLLSFVVVLFSLIHVAQGHGRWKCPPPRDALDNDGNHITFDNTGNKYAACGPQSGKWGFGSVTEISPGWNTIVWEESINHKGSPFRIALLDETETARVILLDHIPHNDATTPVVQVESTYAPYRINVFVPDVDCAKCSLQLLYIMTDKSTKCGMETCYYNPLDAACKGSTNPSAPTCAGAPNSNVCVQENECFSNYHSCTDVVIKGSKPLSEFSLDGQPEDWPFKSKKMQYYGAEVGSWNNATLNEIPSKFNIDYHSFC